MTTADPSLIRSEVRVRGHHGTFRYTGPSRDGTALWVYGPLGSQQRQYRAVTADRVIFPRSGRAKPKPKVPIR